MGRDRVELQKRPEKFQINGPRIWLPMSVLQGAAWASVSSSAKGLLIDLAAQLRVNRSKEINNNGNLTTALAVLGRAGWTSPKTIRSAAIQLEEVQLIAKTRQGHFPNTSNLYAVTWLPLNESDKLDMNARQFPFNGFLLMNPPPVIETSSYG